MLAFALTSMLIIVAIGLGTLTAVINSPVVLFLASPLLFVLIGLKDYRIVVGLIVIISTMGQSRLLPSFSNFNVFNYLVLGAAVSLMLKWFIDRKPLVMLPKAFAFLLVPFSIALLNGLLNLKSLPPSASLIEGVAGVEAMAYAKLVYIRPLLYVALAIMLANAIKSSKNPDRWAAPIAVAGVMPALAVIGLIVGFGVDISMLSRNWGVLGSLGLHKNSLGGALALGLAPLLFLLTVFKGFSARVLLISALIAVAGALLLTFSRGGVTAAIAIWAAFCVYHRRWVTLFLSLLAAPLLLFALPGEIADRLLLGFDGGQSNYGAARSDDELSAGRFWIWQQLLPEIAKRPIFGAGIYGHMWSDLAVNGKQMYPHNFALSSFIDLGIPGAISVFAFYWIVTKGFYRLSVAESMSPTMRALAGSGWAMMLGTFVFGLTGSDYVPGKEQIPLWVMMAVLLAYWDKAYPSAIDQPTRPHDPYLGPRRSNSTTAQA